MPAAHAEQDGPVPEPMPPIPPEALALDDLDVMRATFDAFEQAEPHRGWEPDWAAFRAYLPTASSNRRLARSLVVVGNTSGPALWGLLAAVTAAVGILVLHGLRVPGFSALVTAWILAGAVVGAVVGVARDYRRRIIRVTRTRPLGVPWGVRIGPALLYLQTPASVLVLPYRGFRRIRRCGGFVFLRLDAPLGWISLPADLIPPGAAGWIRERIRRRDGGEVVYRFELQPEASHAASTNPAPSHEGGSEAS